MDQRVDPAIVMPDEVWSKVMGQLDPQTQRLARTVSRDWNARVLSAPPSSSSPSSSSSSSASSRVSSEDVASLHSSSFPLFAAKGSSCSSGFRLFCLSTSVPTAKRAAPVLSPLSVLPPSSSFWLLLSSSASLFLFWRQLFFSFPALLALLLVSLVWPLSRSRCGQTRSDVLPPALPLPLVAAVSFSSLVWSLYVQRLALALDDPSRGGVGGLRLPAFFFAVLLPFRALRHVGWIATAASRASVVSVVLTAAAILFLALRGVRRPPLDWAKKSVPAAVAAAGTVLTTQLAKTSLGGLGETAAAVLVCWTLIMALAVLPAPWFRDEALQQPRLFRLMALVTVVVFPAAVVMSRLV